MKIYHYLNISPTAFVASVFFRTWRFSPFEDGGEGSGNYLSVCCVLQYSFMNDNSHQRSNDIIMFSSHLALAHYLLNRILTEQLRSSRKFLHLNSRTTPFSRVARTHT